MPAATKAAVSPTCAGTITLAQSGQAPPQAALPVCSRQGSARPPGGWPAIAIAVDADGWTAAGAACSTTGVSATPPKLAAKANTTNHASMRRTIPATYAKPPVGEAPIARLLPLREKEAREAGQMRVGRRPKKRF